MSETKIQFQQPEGERLYRYHPDTGFTEVTSAQNTAMDSQAEQVAQSAQYGQSQMYGEQVAQAMPNTESINTSAPYYGYMPPFAPQMSQVGAQLGMPSVGMPPVGMPAGGMPFSTPQVGAQVGATVGAPTAMPHLGVPPLGMTPQVAAYHEAHMKQMQEYANAQAAYMAFMAQNGAVLGAAQGTQNAQSAQSAEQSTQASSTEFSQERMQAMYQTVNDVINGKAEPEKVLGLFQGISTDFWKGAAIGAAAIALYNYTPLKDMITTSLGTLLAATGLASKGAKDDNLDEDGFEKEPETKSEDSAQ